MMASKHCLHVKEVHQNVEINGGDDIGDNVIEPHSTHQDIKDIRMMIK
jgi:hypothetical protein